MKRKKQKKPKASAETFRTLLGHTPIEKPDAESQSLRQNLRTKFLHDESKIDHAIQFERDRNPSASTKALMQAAITRYERDNQ